VLNEKPRDEDVWDRRGVTPLILNLGTDGGERSYSFLSHFTALSCLWVAEELVPQLEEKEVSHCHEANHDMLVALPMV